MNSIARSVSSVELRDQLADVISRVSYARERIGITKHGRLAAVLVSVEDFELLEQLEAARKSTGTDSSA